MKVTIQGAVPIDKVGTDSKRHSQFEDLKPDPEQKVQRGQHTELSNVSKIAQKTFDNLSQQHDVDMVKIKQIQQAIKNGELQLDQDVLIKALLDMHK